VSLLCALVCLPEAARRIGEFLQCRFEFGDGRLERLERCFGFALVEVFLPRLECVETLGASAFPGQ